jgi:hypothetical protein
MRPYAVQSHYGPQPGGRHDQEGNDASRAPTKTDLPAGYHVRWDPDILTLHRGDGSMVAAFSTEGAVTTRAANVAADDLPDTDKGTA